MAAIRRDFLPADLKSTIDDARVDGVVSVQARQCIEETDWLLEMAAQNPFIKGVVGWLPIANPSFEKILERYAGNHHLKSLRHVIQGEADENYILRPDFNNGINALASTSLAYDILIFERHLLQTIKFVDKHPNQTFVIDHIAKPKIAKGIVWPWRENIMELGKRPNVYCKISGMVTEADYKNWTEEQLRPYFDTVLEAFTPQRLMFGSDWPVMLVGVDYQDWLDMLMQEITHLTVDEQLSILGNTAIEAYNLK
jgi:L-fuconolactonase